jgi:hypothetical protein
MQSVATSTYVLLEAFTNEASLSFNAEAQRLWFRCGIFVVVHKPVAHDDTIPVRNEQAASSMVTHSVGQSAEELSSVACSEGSIQWTINRSPNRHAY